MTGWTIRSAADALRSGEVTSVQLTAEAFATSDRHDGKLGTYLARFDEQAMEAAQRADDELAAGHDRGPLHGIPLGIKDIIATDEGPTTAQSLVQDPTWGDQGDGPVIERLRGAGAVLTGKTTTMEYAIGRPDMDKPFPIPRNPWDTDRWTGGSSSGTANGIASGQFLGGLGTDTGGSVRLPAAYCGITGHKQTFGLVPKSGCVPLGLSYDHIGPMARTAWDCAAMLTVMAGAHGSDRTTVERPPTDYLAELEEVGAPTRIGIVANASIRDSAAASMLAAFDEAIATMSRDGIDVVEVEIDYYDTLAEGAFLALQAEAFAWHRDQLRDRWDDYGRPTRLTIAQGALISGGDLIQVERAREVGRRAALDAMDRHEVTVLASPTTGYAATPFTGADPKAVSMSALHTPAWNSTGFPAVSAPMGFDEDGLPCGLQLIGRPFDDGVVLAAAHRYQQLTDWHERTPPLHAATE